MENLKENGCYMSDFLATTVDVIAWINALASKQTLYFPVQHGKVSYRYEKIAHGGDAVQFDHYTPSVVPPVKLMVPAHEALLTFKKQEGATEVTSTLDQSFRIIAGVRACDLKGIFLMDLFLKEGVADPYYLTRREHTAIIGYACTKPCDDRVFCAAVDSLDHREGADVFLTPVKGGDILVEGKTELGANLLKDCELRPCDDGPARRVGAVSDRQEPFGRSLKAAITDIPGLIENTQRSPVWQKHVERCFSCGTCNLVCPTCYCFDVHDDLDLDVNSGHRARTWDACMLPHFAVVAGGHSFRPEPAARQRHRGKRKFEYLTEKFSQWAACVGCGRCGRQCTSHIDIFDIVNDLIQEGGG